MYYNIWLAVLYDNNQFKQFYPRNKKNKKERQFCSHFCIYRRWIHFASTNHVTSSTFHHDLSMFWLISTPSHYPWLGLLLQITVFYQGDGEWVGGGSPLNFRKCQYIQKGFTLYISTPVLDPPMISKQIDKLKCLTDLHWLTEGYLVNTVFKMLRQNGVGASCNDSLFFPSYNM